MLDTIVASAFWACPTLAVAVLVVYVPLRLKKLEKEYGEKSASFKKKKRKTILIAIGIAVFAFLIGGVLVAGRSGVLSKSIASDSSVPPLPQVEQFADEAAQYALYIEQEALIVEQKARDVAMRAHSIQPNDPGYFEGGTDGYDSYKRVPSEVGYIEVHDYADGYSYAGELSETKEYSGYGVLTFPDEGTTASEWDGTNQQIGLFVSRNGGGTSFYAGEQRTQNVIYYGVHRQHDGYYAGQFVDGQFNGYGVYYYSSGVEKMGLWLESRYIPN